MKLFIAACAILGMCTNTLAGDLNPPAGPVAPTPGPEPRIAINATNTPGDADSIYKIMAPGSYYLTGNLTGVAGKNGIEIGVSGVTVDLMGFEVRGVAGSLDGITASGSLLVNITLRNGMVRDWGEDGVEFSGGNVRTALVESIQSASNDHIGIYVGNSTIIRQCTATENGNDGFDTGAYCTVVECISNQNAVLGYDLSFSCTISQSSAANNTDDGISLGTGSTATACTAFSNDADGFEVGVGALVSACSAYDNGSNGISMSSGGYALNNSCARHDAGAGIESTGSDNRIEGNSCYENDYGYHIFFGGNIIVRNTATANTVSNWEIAAGNAALVVAATTSAAISGDSGGTSPGSANPSANYTY